MEEMILQQSRELLRLTADTIVKDRSFHKTQISTLQQEITTQAEVIASHPPEAAPEPTPPPPGNEPAPAPRTKKSDKLPDPVRYAGGRKYLEHCGIQLMIKLKGNPQRLGTQRAAKMYTICCIEGDVLAQVSA